MSIRPKNWRQKFAVPKGATEIEEGGIIVTEFGSFKKENPTARRKRLGIETQIFKLQRSLFSTSGPNILVTNEDKSLLSEIPYTSEWDWLFPKGSDKIYVIGTPDFISGKLDITHVISDQGW